jgi:aldehyde:ferredoxin oxidoreductase
MGADHTAGAAIAGRVSSLHKDYGEVTLNEMKLDLSFELQVYTTVLDSVGCCYFIGPSFENMEIVAGAINAMYDLNLSVNDVINIGKQILKTEIDFNEKAGITSYTNDIPSFFRDEESIPTKLKYNFEEEALKTFWKKLDDHIF